jgi:hypothetical protein
MLLIYLLIIVLVTLICGAGIVIYVRVFGKTFNGLIKFVIGGTATILAVLALILWVRQFFV